MPKSSTHNLIRLFHTRWFFVVNLVLILFVAFSFARELIHGHDIAVQVRSLQQQAQDLQAQHLAIADLKSAVQTESYAEREARLKLGLKKPGESLVILKGESTSDVSTKSASAVLAGNGSEQTATPATTLTQKPLANSTKWWYYFFNKQLYRENE